MDFDKDHFDVLRKVGKKSNLTQRKLASDLGFSIGKLNYCLKKLQNKGFIKIKNFKKNPNKLNYVYILTPKGITQKAKLTYNFMQRMMKEYDELKSELDEEKENVDNN
tara:strand:+ start:1799 stop:2122 length:324 start_codon:yes stop_codon:yes gene_type:complete